MSYGGYTMGGVLVELEALDAGLGTTDPWQEF